MLRKISVREAPTKSGFRNEEKNCKRFCHRSTPVILALGRAHDTHDSEAGKAETYLDFVESFRPGST